MPHLAHITLIVRDYDEALAFYVGKLGFTLVEDTPQPEQDKRWVTIRPPGAPPNATTILLARAVIPDQTAAIGDQTGGRVFLFLATDDFDRDHAAFTAAGVEWVRPPATYDYGRVAVFKDLYGICGTSCSTPTHPPLLPQPPRGRIDHALLAVLDAIPRRAPERIAAGGHRIAVPRLTERLAERLMRGAPNAPRMLLLPRLVARRGRVAHERGMAAATAHASIIIDHRAA